MEVLVGKRGCSLLLETDVGTEWSLSSMIIWLVGLFIHLFTCSSVIQQMLFEHRLFAGYRAGLLHVYAVTIDTCSSIELLMGHQTLVAVSSCLPVPSTWRMAMDIHLIRVGQCCNCLEVLETQRHSSEEYEHWVSPSWDRILAPFLSGWGLGHIT